MFFNKLLLKLLVCWQLIYVISMFMIFFVEHVVLNRMSNKKKHLELLFGSNETNKCMLEISIGHIELYICDRLLHLESLIFLYI
jgi:hypothetical protein